MNRKDHLTIARELHDELSSRAKKYDSTMSGLSKGDIDQIRNHFMPLGLKNCKLEHCEKTSCPSRCSEGYWSDHGLITKQLMENFANKLGENADLYGVTGLLHDIDYLKYPHDRGEYVGRHPIPLIKHLMRLNANPNMAIAIFEHAPHLGLANSSRLSLALTGCEELATLMSFDNKEKLSQLSELAHDLTQSIEVSYYVDETIDGTPRVFNSPEKSINSPLQRVLETEK